MIEKRALAANLVLETIPKLMRALAFGWRHIEHTIDPGHFRLLLILTQGPRNLSELAAKLQVSLPTMSKTISTLEERGWVVRRRDPTDRRRVHIEITSQGCKTLEHIRDVALEQVGKALAPLSTEECEQIIVGLQTLSRVFDQAFECSPCEEDHPSDPAH